MKMSPTLKAYTANFACTLVGMNILLTGIWLAGALVFAEGKTHQQERYYIAVHADTPAERSNAQTIGMSVEAVASDRVWGFADQSTIHSLIANGFQVLSKVDASVGIESFERTFDFPSEDDAFHTYEETLEEIGALESEFPDKARAVVLGQSLEGRELVAIHINTDTEALETGASGKPGIVFTGAHHAREHLSTEVPLKLARHLLESSEHPTLGPLLASRDIWIVPIVNPDGKVFDISRGRYENWRKNRRRNSNGSYGVDLNRNYGFGWGGGGASTNPNAETYRGTHAFSEPETQTIRDFVSSLPNLKILLSFHTFSELVLYPWGYTDSPINNRTDYQIHKTMAETMAQWNGYTPQQSSDLYIASGDTTDWSYGELGIISFTFELSPTSMWNGGFYPGARWIDRAFRDNLQPCLYLIEYADNPERVLN